MSGLNARHFDGAGQQSGEPVGFFVGHGQQLALHGIASRIRENGGDGRLNGGQRRFELMRQRVQQSGLKLLILPRSFGVVCGFLRPSAFDSNRSQLRHGLESGFREGGPHQTQAAQDSAPETHRQNRRFLTHRGPGRFVAGRVAKLRLQQAGVGPPRWTVSVARSYSATSGIRNTCAMLWAICAAMPR